MSGGSWDYAYDKISQIVEGIEEEDAYCNRQHPLKDRLVLHLKELAELMYLIEWCDSGDKGPDEWVEPAEKFFARITESENKC